MIRIAALILVCLGASVAFAQDKPVQDKPVPADPPKAEPKKPDPRPDSKGETGDGEATATQKSPLEFKCKDIDGTEVDLNTYKGKVVLIVNVASKCGLTKQYTQLQELHERFGKRGLTILAFPANNFMGQEPGTNTEIKEFCAKEYSIGFKLFSKISVKGDDIDPLYKWLTSKDKNPDHAGEIKWNFTKFLLDREGKVVSRFEPKVKPDAKEVVEAIEKVLGDKKE